MYPQTEPALVPTPITINSQGASPPNATISVSINGGAIINATMNCTLVFDPGSGCPFQNANGNNLSIQQGNNQEPLKPGVSPGTYPYAINTGGGPGTDPFDVTITP